MADRRSQAGESSCDLRPAPCDLVRARIVHFTAVDPGEDRRRTLQALIALAEGNSPADCWNDQYAADLLRSQSSAEELRELGMSEAMIAMVFPEGDER